MVRFLCRGYIVSKVLTTITLLMLTACGEEQRSRPVMHAASALQATGQGPATPYPSGHIQEPRKQKPRIDMRRITNEIYEILLFSYPKATKRPTRKCSAGTPGTSGPHDGGVRSRFANCGPSS
jgi:hypothetical protein